MNMNVIQPTKTLYLALLACTTSGFLLTLAIYVVAFGGNPMNRLGYATFISVAPAAVVWLLMKLLGWPVNKLGAVMIYVSLFSLIVIGQAWLR
jgi:hypothetical protein